jgi:UDP-N-acetylmuramoyl-tripeptide--D-alanyl-D-alanine ligase
VKLTEIAKIIDADMKGNNCDIDIKSISTDSRTIKKGELFIALKGNSFCGSDFISNAVKKGASAIITDDISGPGKCVDVPLLFVKKSVDALSMIAKAHRDTFDIPFICIVGSNGKTTTKELLSHILASKFRVLKTEENYNNQIGVAKTLLRLKKHDIAVIETGTNSPGEIAYNGKIINPDIVITLNIGRSHLAGLKTIQGVFREKIAMVKSLKKGGTWIRNCDDKALLKYNRKGIKTIDFAIKNKKTCYRAEDITCVNKGMEFTLKGKKVFLPLLGAHNVYNCLAAIAAAAIFLNHDTIIKTLASFRPAPMRMQVSSCNNFIIINDAYNANPDSLESAVYTLKELHSLGRKMLVCADMLELGKRSGVIHQACGRFIAQSGAIDKLILFGQQAAYTCKGALEAGMKKRNIIKLKDKNDIVCFLKKHVSENDIVLVKGSRSMKMEEVVRGLLDSHRT